MASRYGVFARSARSAFQSSFRRRSSAAGNPLSGRTRNPGNNTDNAAFRRRFSGISRLPFELGCALHDAVADARLKSHLAVNSRTCNTVSLGLRGYINAALPNVRRRSIQAGWALTNFEEGFMEL